MMTDQDVWTDLPTIFRTLLTYGILQSGPVSNEARGRRFRSSMGDFKFFEQLTGEYRVVMEAGCELVAMTLYNPDKMIEFACGLNDEQIMLLYRGISELHSKGHYAPLQSESREFCELFFTLRRRWINGVTQRRKRARDQSSRLGGTRTDTSDGAIHTSSSADEAPMTQTMHAPTNAAVPTSSRKRKHSSPSADAIMAEFLQPGTNRPVDIHSLASTEVLDSLDVFEHPMMILDGETAFSASGDTSTRRRGATKRGTRQLPAWAAAAASINGTPSLVDEATSRGRPLRERKLLPKPDSIPATRTSTMTSNYAPASANYWPQRMPTDDFTSALFSNDKHTREDVAANALLAFRSSSVPVR